MTQLGTYHAKPLASLVMSLASFEKANSVVGLSQSPLFHHRNGEPSIFQYSRCYQWHMCQRERLGVHQYKNSSLLYGVLRHTC